MAALLLLSKDDSIAKVGKFDLTICLDKDVIRLDVSVNDVLSVQVNKALERLVNTVLAELFRILALKLLEHGCECTSIHELHEYPKAILEVKRLIALYDRFALAHLHNADFIFNRCPFCTILGLSELEGKQLSISDSHATENTSEATSALFSHDLVELRRVLLLNIGCMADFPANLTAVL